MFLNKPWPEITFIAIDLECTGKYPLEAEICEMAAVKWQKGQITDTFQTLIKPKHRMSQEVIDIHNITNEMVESAPPIQGKLQDFHNFIKDGVTLAHHIPFDMGFLAWDFEQQRLPLPPHPALCTSLLSRALNFNVANHRMPTLIEHFKLEKGQLHRALDDAQTALQIAMKYFEKAGPQATLQELIKIQNVDLNWPRFSIEALYEKDHLRQLVRAVTEKREIAITYNSGSKPGQARKILPHGIVRNPDGDFLAATESHRDDNHPKRYYLQHISAVTAAT